MTNTNATATVGARVIRIGSHEQTVDGQRVQYSGWINTTRDISDNLRALATRIASFTGEDNVHAITYRLRANGVRVTLKG